MDDRTTLTETDAESHARWKKEIGKALAAEDWPIQLKLAIACRKLASEGHNTSLAGQVSARNGDGTYWAAPLKGGFANVTQSSVIRFNQKLELIEGDQIPNPGLQFHFWIYEKRPDVNAIVHTHPPHAAALSMTGKGLEVSHMDTCVFYNDCGHLKEWPGVPIANEEGRLISEALGDKRSVLLAHHGYLTVGSTLEEATYLAVMFEEAARMQLLAQSVGEIKPIRPELAQEAHDFLLGPSIVNGTFNSWAYELLRKEPDVRA